MVCHMNLMNSKGLTLVGCAVFLSFLSIKSNNLLVRQECLTHASTLETKAEEKGKKKPSLDLSDYDGPQTTYQPWPLQELPFPCVKSEANWDRVNVQRSPAKTGLLYVREMKTGSSTMAGVILRLSHRKGEKLLSDEGPCRMRIDHSSARKLKYKDRNKDRSFLISLLRDPTKRAISQFFHFRVSDKKEDPTDENFQNYFFDDPGHRRNYFTKDLTTVPIDWETADKNEVVQSIIDEYNFIGITERMDDSLVVLKMLLDLDFEDILYMSAKTNGSFTTGMIEEGVTGCIYIVPSFITDGMKEFFASDYWKRYVEFDNLLYKAAVKSLDNTIDFLGREEFEQELTTFKKAQKVTQERCADRTIYRCNNRGEFVGAMNSTCYMWDIGCGFDCLNEMSLDDMNLDEVAL